MPHDGPTIFFCGRHEPRKGLDVLLEAMAAARRRRTRCWVAGDGPDTGRLRAEYADDARIEWLGRITDDEKIARLRGRRRVLRAVAGRRVVRGRADRGDGGRDADRRQRPRRLPQRGPTDDVDALLVAAGRRRRAGRRAASGCWATPTLADRLRAPAARAGRRRSRWTASPQRYVEIYEALIAASRPPTAGESAGARGRRRSIAALAPPYRWIAAMIIADHRDRARGHRCSSCTSSSPTTG